MELRLELVSGTYSTEETEIRVGKWYILNRGD